jgi:hypothetical protein
VPRVLEETAYLSPLSSCMSFVRWCLLLACCELENLGTSRLEALIKEMLLFSEKIQCLLTPSLCNATLLSCKSISPPLYDAMICPVQPAVVDEDKGDVVAK